MTIDKFFQKMLVNFQEGCAFFSLFYRSFYTDMKLYNFKSMTFFLIYKEFYFIMFNSLSSHSIILLIL